jgi:hypothetical protein
MALYISTSVGTSTSGCGIVIAGVGTPDLDLIKQAEQGVRDRRGAVFARDGTAA